MYTNLTCCSLPEIERQQTDLKLRFMALRTNSGIADPAIENPAFEKEWVDFAREDRPGPGRVGLAPAQSARGR